jgi:group I intron endonuclease
MRNKSNTKYIIDNKKINDNKIKLIPVLTYNNVDIDKSRVYEENRNKSGVYRLVNKINGKSYIGSSVNLSRRFRIYYSLNSIKRKLNKGSSAIYSALLKYSHDNFSLDILEYCNPDTLIKREQYYIDQLKPEYNILQIAGNKLGFKHSEMTKAQMSINHKGINHPFFCKSLTYE